MLLYWSLLLCPVAWIVGFVCAKWSCVYSDLWCKALTSHQIFSQNLDIVHFICMKLWYNWVRLGFVVFRNLLDYWFVLLIRPRTNNDLLLASGSLELLASWIKHFHAIWQCINSWAEITKLYCQCQPAIENIKTFMHSKF